MLSIYQGLPFAVITAMASASKPMTGALFGTVNYLVLTSLLEIIRTHHEIDKPTAVALIGISGSISWAFVQTVCKTALTYQAAIILTTAAFAAQVARRFFVTEDYE